MELKPNSRSKLSQAWTQNNILGGLHQLELWRALWIVPGTPEVYVAQKWWRRPRSVGSKNGKVQIIQEQWRSRGKTQKLRKIKPHWRLPYLHPFKVVESSKGLTFIRENKIALVTSNHEADFSRNNL